MRVLVNPIRRTAIILFVGFVFLVKLAEGEVLLI
jgi:hypothetical protein